MKINCIKTPNLWQSKINKKLLTQAYNKKHGYKPYTPIATDGLFIYDGKKILAENYFYPTPKNKRLIVLTNKEKNDLLFNFWKDDFHIHSFEKEFPFFDYIKYQSSPKKNYDILVNLLSKMKGYGYQKNSFFSQEMSVYRKKIFKKIKKRTNFEAIFELANTGPYQEVFRFSEERENRKVIALDFNSMFPFCMTDSFLDPSSIDYVTNLNCDKHYKIKELPDGLYFAELSGVKSSFFQSFHPFKIFHYFKPYSFQLKNTQKINILLLREEIEYYSKFFSYININEGYISKKKSNIHF